MYQLSRSIYRELAPDILADPIPPTAGTNHERVLRADRGRGLPPGDGSPLLRAAVADAVPRDPHLLPDRVAGPRLPRGRPLHDVRPQVVRGARRPAATTSPATAWSAAPRPARARRASARRSPTTATAPPTSTSPDGEARHRRRRRRSRSRASGRSLARHARRLHRAGDHGLAPGREPRARRPRAPRLQPHPRDRRGMGGGARRARSPARPREAADGADAVITMVVDGAQVEEMLLGEDGAAARRPRADAVHRLLDDRARRTPAASAAPLTRAGHGFVDAPVTGSAPKAEDGTLTIMCGGSDEDMRARPAAARGDGREDRPRRRGRPGPGGQGHLQLGQRHQLRRARPGAGGRPPRRRRPRGAARGDGLRLGQLDDAPAQGQADARARLLAALQARAHAQGRRPVPRRGARRTARRSRSRRSRGSSTAPGSAAASASRTSPPCSRSSRASPTRASEIALETRVEPFLRNRSY